MEAESLIAIFKITLNCPANCPSCSSRKATFAKMRPRVMTLEYFNSCMQELAKIGTKTISLSGGEPTLLDNLSDYIIPCRDYGINSQLNTNGWSITDEKLSEWLDSGLNTVILSCYSLHRESFTRLRGTAILLDKAKQSIEVIERQRRKKEFTAILQTIITPVNMMELPILFRTAVDSGFDLFWPSYLEDSVNLPHLRMTRQDMERLKCDCVPEMREIASSIRDIRVRELVYDQLDLLFNHPGMIPSYVETGDYGHIARDCPLVENFALFYPDRSIAPCAGHEYHWSSFVEKNQSQGLTNILYGDKFTQFRQQRMTYCRYCPHGLHVGLPLRFGVQE